MKVKAKIKKKLRHDNQLSLKVAMKLDIHQAALFRRIERNSETLFNDIRVIGVLKDEGFTDEEIFEAEPIAYKSLSNN
jgi:hypothetical protein